MWDTRYNLLKPLRDAMKFEVSDDHTTAPWCEIAQRKLLGMPDDKPIERMSVISVYKEKSKPFEDTRVNYTPDSTGNVTFNVSGHNKYYSMPDLNDQCITAAKEIGCKMASADRVAQ